MSLDKYETFVEIMGQLMGEYIDNYHDGDFDVLALKELRKFEIYLMAQMKKLAREMGGED